MSYLEVSPTISANLECSMLRRRVAELEEQLANRDMLLTQRNEALHFSRLQEAVIRAQEATLAELSTPLLAISDRVLVMPLIGVIDPRRAQQVIENLLAGVTQRRASAVILDITGVSVVDTQVANALMSAAQAVRLLGARVIITGIRPEVAQTLVGLGVDLSGITTKASLQNGIAEALR
jgi:rsbT co-antagonist protein RsbR